MIRRRRNLDGYMEGGVFHPIRGSEGYDDERLGDTGFSFGANDPVERKKAERAEAQSARERQRAEARDAREKRKAEEWEEKQREKESAASKRAWRRGRHTFTGVGEDDYTGEGLAHFVRRHGGIRIKKGDAFFGEVDGTLSQRETGTTGLIRRVDPTSGLRRAADIRGGLSPEYMRDAAVVDRLIPEDASISDFLMAVEKSVALEQKGGKRRNPTWATFNYRADGAYKKEDRLKFYMTQAQAERAAEKASASGAKVVAMPFAAAKNPRSKTRKPLAREFGESDTGTQPRLFIMGDKKHAGQQTMEELFSEGEKMPAKQKNPISAQRVRRKAKTRVGKKGWLPLSAKDMAIAAMRDAQNKKWQREAMIGRHDMALWEKTPRKRNFKISAAGKLRIGKNPPTASEKILMLLRKQSTAQLKALLAAEKGKRGAVAGADLQTVRRAIAAELRRRANPKKRRNVSIKVGGRSKFRATKKGVTIGGRVTLKANPGLGKCERCGSVDRLILAKDDIDGERVKICGHCFKHGDYSRVRKPATKRLKANPKAAPADHVAARELYLFAINDYALYQQAVRDFIPNVARKIKSGRYDKSKAPKLYSYLAERAAKKYTREYGGPSGVRAGQIFSPATRLEVGRLLADEYHQAAVELAQTLGKKANVYQAATRRRVATTRRGLAYIPRKQNGLFEAFHGRRATKENVLNAPDGTPKRLDKLGKLVSLHAEGGTIKPRATVWLCADSRGKLHLCTSAARLIDGGPQNFGQVKKIEYETTKNHLDNKPTIYYHHFGEEGGARPTLHSDGRGGLKLKGGAYKIRAEGIRN